MSSYVLDTSAAVAWYLDQSCSSKAREWQERLLTGRISAVVPSLHYWEFGNALRSLVVRRELDAELGRDIYDIHMEAPLLVSEPQPASVLDVALEYDATVYDAVYITLSRQLDIPLITAEKTTHAWVVKMKDRIESVR